MDANKVLVCIGCGGRDHHVILRGGMTDGHRRSHEKRGRSLDVREMSCEQAERFLAVAEARRAKTPGELAAERAERIRIKRVKVAEAAKAAIAARKAERKAAGEAARKAREAKHAAAAAAQTAAPVVAADPHAGKVECGCGRWVPPERLAAHQRNPDCLQKRGKKHAAERNAEARKEVVAEVMTEEAAEAYVASLNIPDSFEAESLLDAEDAAEERRLTKMQEADEAEEEIGRMAEAWEDYEADAEPLPPMNPAPLVAKPAKKSFLAKLFGG